MMLLPLAEPHDDDDLQEQRPGQDTAAKPQEISVDEATRLVLRQRGAGYSVEATEFELDPAVDADTFSTDPVSYTHLTLPTKRIV